MDWYIEVMKKYAVFSGRARRKEYWMFVLFNTIIVFVLGFALGFLDGMLNTNIGVVVVGIYNLAVFIPSLAVSIRRMHDLGRSGWWILVPIVNIVFLFLNGQPQANEYGPDPKAGEAH